MNINQKLKIVGQSIQSIAAHSDEDAHVRLAALDAVSGQVQDARDAIEAELNASIKAALSGE